MRPVEGTERVRVHGDLAVVTARVTNTARFGGREFHADEWTTDVYHRTPHGWLCVHSHVTPAQT
ncbi:nuclear transport factor 2 family protein [Nocardiopsis dassonvillei]|uniref:nuclear transport factor 2 family protein n=1 Tax=Nocardiopsis dassonvillei TaxID=2014 RepID=UPI0020A5F6F2|nr:nuclear transport factor 2 family protein [Nocardiopsis dassonvillei]MCP3015753.1 nuclear transport factor 2 family protein [Nocardiopsis dassonvillei]